MLLCIDENGSREESVRFFSYRNSQKTAVSSFDVDDDDDYYYYNYYNELNTADKLSCMMEQIGEGQGD